MTMLSQEFHVVAGTQPMDLDGQGIVIPASELDVALHNGFITMLNPKSGEWRTIKVYTLKKKGHPFNGARRVALLTGPDNGSDYLDFGFITKAGVLVVYPSKRELVVVGRSAYQIMADMISNPVKWETKGVEYRISGICRRCNRRLTVPESIDSGLGPECRKKVA